MTELPRGILKALGLPSHSVARKMAGGSQTPVWCVDAGERRYAIRLGPAAREADIDREAHALRAARLGGIPVPEVLRVQVVGTFACLLTTWCPGETVASAVLGDRADPARLGEVCGRMQAQIHTIDVPAALGSANAGWLRPTPDEEGLLARVAPRQTSRLLHLDFHPLNILTDGERVTGVVDWVNAGAGDPRQDLARTLAILRLDLPPDVISSPGALARVEALSDAWAKGYKKVAGDLEHMDLFMAWAGIVTLRDVAPKRPPDVVRSMQTVVASWVEVASV